VVGAVVLARRDSERLPDKCLSPIAGRPMLARVLELCGRVPGVERVCLATTDRAVDDELATLARVEGCEVFRGDTEHVARRFLGAMRQLGVAGALRVNGDSPLHRAALLGEGVAMFNRLGPDLVSNVPGRTYPFGLSVEVVATTAMERAVAAMIDPAHAEHVTKYFYDHPDEFDAVYLQPGPAAGRGLQLAVDDALDLERARFVADALGGRLHDASIDEVIALARGWRRATDQTAHARGRGA
jgi:spore coat polysaccharide biosynthesis protein SpsF (cytidylyltransferase family)